MVNQTSARAEDKANLLGLLLGLLLGQSGWAPPAQVLTMILRISHLYDSKMQPSELLNMAMWYTGQVRVE